MGNISISDLLWAKGYDTNGDGKIGPEEASKMAPHSAAALICHGLSGSQDEDQKLIDAFAEQYPNQAALQKSIQENRDMHWCPAARFAASPQAPQTNFSTAAAYEASVPQIVEFIKKQLRLEGPVDFLRGVESGELEKKISQNVGHIRYDDEKEIYNYVVRLAKAETKKLLENPNTPDAIAIEFGIWTPKEITRRVAKHEQLTQLWNKSRNFFTDTVIVGTHAIVSGKGGVALPYIVFKDGREMRMEFIPLSDRIDTGIGKGYVRTMLARVFDPVSGESHVYLVPGELIGAVNPYKIRSIVIDFFSVRVVGSIQAKSFQKVETVIW